MQIRTETSVYITPDKGQTGFEISNEIADAIKEGKINGKMFFNLPDGSTIPIEGKTMEEIRTSIFTQWSGDTSF